MPRKGEEVGSTHVEDRSGTAQGLPPWELLGVPAESANRKGTASKGRRKPEANDTNSWHRHPAKQSAGNGVGHQGQGIPREQAPGNTFL